VIRKRRVIGRKDMGYVPTSFVERQNLTMRMRRFTRLTKAFSKKIENLVNAISLHFAYDFFVKVRKTRRMSPTTAVVISDRLWEMADLVAVVEAAETRPGKREPYRAR
jgi:hypothetical protein